MIRILHGDALVRLRELPDESVQCVVTSPPYWGLRDYGVPPTDFPAVTFTPIAGVLPVTIPAALVALGLEQSPMAFVGHLLCVFREIHRVLKKDGVAWVNMGDCYAGSGRGPDTNSTLEGSRQSQAESRKAIEARGARIGSEHGETGHTSGVTPPDGLKSKDMVGLPWMLAFALRSDGWFLRSDILWHKPNPMPEICKDRPTKAHEYLFLLAKSRHYYYNAEAIKEPVTGGANPRGGGVNPKCAGWVDGPGKHEAIDHARPGGSYKGSVPGRKDGPGQTRRSTRTRQNESFSGAVRNLVETRNKRSVWTVPSSPYTEAHFATYPPDLVKPCVLAGTRPGDMVLDPFGGSGTTGMVALELGRRATLIELNPEYVRLIEKRTSTTLGLALESEAAA